MLVVEPVQHVPEEVHVAPLRHRGEDVARLDLAAFVEAVGVNARRGFARHARGIDENPGEAGVLEHDRPHQLACPAAHVDHRLGAREVVLLD